MAQKFLHLFATYFFSSLFCCLKSIMHPRRRSPGNGHWSNPMGTVTASRISPENLGRGYGLCISKYRRFNRGFGRCHRQSKSFHHSPPSAEAPSRKADIFMDAGRLAAEYLVSQGILPQDTNTGKRHNGNLKGFQEFRDSDCDMQCPVDGRASALGRLQDSESDMEPSRRRYSDEHGNAGFRNYVKGKRRGGSLRGYGSEWSCVYGRSGSWSDQREGSHVIDAGHEYDLGNQEEQLVTRKDSTFMEKLNNEMVKSKESGGAPESKTKEHESGAASSGAKKDIHNETDGKGVWHLSSSQELSISKGRNEQMNNKDAPGNEETTKEVISEELPRNNSSENLNLQSLCKITSVQKIQSIRGSRGSKEEKISDAGTSQVSDVLIEGKAVDGSIINVVDTRDAEIEISTLGTLQAAQALNPMPRSLVLDESQESNEKRGEKWVIEEINTNEYIKGAREQSVVADMMGEPVTEGKVTTVDDCHQERMKNIFQTSEIGEVSYAEEKQLIPGLFKICDLNLMETSDINETNDRDSIFIYPPMSDFKMEVGPVDIDVSISNSRMSSRHAKQVDDSDREIEVINLDEDSAPEDGECGISETK